MERTELTQYRVAVLSGGWSDERDISMSSGRACQQALREAGFITVELLDIADVHFVECLSAGDYDVAFKMCIRDRGYSKLIRDNGLTQEQLGKILSKSRSSIANTLRLLDLPEEVQDMMAEGKLSAGHARAILAVADEEARIRLARKVLEERLSVRQTESLAPLFSGVRKEEKRREPTPNSFKRAARQLRLALNASVRVKRVRNRNKIEIEFEDEEELARLVSLFSREGME